MPTLLDDYGFDRFLRYQELVEWIDQPAAARGYSLPAATGEKQSAEPTGATGATGAAET